MTEAMVSTRTISPPCDKRSRIAGAPPGPRQREQRFSALLDAAAGLFVEKGVAATSIDDIALRAGVAKGTFYHYFQDRAAMLAALRRRYAQHFADAVQVAIDACDEDDWQAKLSAWVGTLTQVYISTYALHDAIFHDPSVCHRWVMSEEPILQHLAALIRDGDKAGAWQAEEPLASAICMFHSVHGLVDEAIATGSGAEGVAPFLSRLFLNMLRAPGPQG